MSRKTYGPDKIKPLRPDPAKDRAELELLREKISDLVKSHPDKAAIILTDWLTAPCAAGRRPAAPRKKAG